jgi:hypothetical protein
VSEDRELRIGEVDQLHVERFLPVERHDLSVGQPDTEMAMPIIRDRENGELSCHAAKRVRRVLLEKAFQCAA